jgi:toxin YoeB
VRKIIFLDKAWKDINSLDDLQTNISIFKIFRLIEECRRTPFKGIGKPEALKGDFKGYWSRRINETDRLIYRVEEDIIYIVSILGHYK